MISVRCSSLPMLFACGASGDSTALQVNRVSDVGKLGTAVHYGLSELVMGRPFDTEEHARVVGVDAGDLGMLVGVGWNMWTGKYGEALKDAHGTDVVTECEWEWSYQDLQGDIVKLTGHPDTFSKRGLLGVVDDWKTGHRDTDYRAQLEGYAALALMMDETLEACSARVVWLRAREVEHYHMTRAELIPWLERLTAAARDTARFQTGAHCKYCPRQATCPAIEAEEKRALALVGEPDLAVRLAAMPSPDLAALFRVSKQLEDRTREVQGMIKALADERGGLPDGNGSVLRHVDQEHREVDVLKAWGVLRPILSDEQMAKCLKLTPGKLDDVLTKHAGRGKGAELRRDVQNQLVAAGALTRKTVRKFESVRESAVIEAKETE